MRIDEFAGQSLINTSLAEQAMPATNLNPQQFQNRYGMSHAQLRTTVGNIIELFPQEVKNNPRFKNGVQRFVLNNPASAQAANDNLFNINKDKGFWKNFKSSLLKAPLRTAGLAISLLLTASPVGETPEQMEVLRIQNDMWKDDPEWYNDVFNSEWTQGQPEIPLQDPSTLITPTDLTDIGIPLKLPVPNIAPVDLPDAPIQPELPDIGTPAELPKTAPVFDPAVPTHIAPFDPVFVDLTKPTTGPNTRPDLSNPDALPSPLTAPGTSGTTPTNTTTKKPKRKQTDRSTGSDIPYDDPLQRWVAKYGQDW